MCVPIASRIVAIRTERSKKLKLRERKETISPCYRVEKERGGLLEAERRSNTNEVSTRQFRSGSYQLGEARESFTIALKTKGGRRDGLSAML